MSIKKLILTICGLMIMCGATSYAQGVCIYSDGTEWELSKVMEKKGHEIGFVKFCCEELGMCSNAYRNEKGERLTHSAAKGKNYEALAYLINEHKIAYDDFRKDPNTLKYVEDYTQLMYTARNGDYKSTDFLLKKGADPCRKNQWSKNSLYYARESKNQQTISAVEKYAKEKNCFNDASGKYSYLDYRQQQNKSELIKNLALTEETQKALKITRAYKALI